MELLKDEPNHGVRPQTRRAPSRGHTRLGLLFPILMFAPLLIGARGCNDAVVGECPAWSENCETGEAGAGGGGSDSACGGLLGLSCARGEFCNTPIDAICGAADQTGVCAPIPSACALVYSPVCGCDGKTYGNECEAARASSSVASRGVCQDPAAKACGGLLGLSCARGEFCNYPLDAICGAADQTGVCAQIPSACDLVYSPVCGCDGKTYSNECEAAMAGSSVVSRGVCQDPGAKACGGLLGLSCARGEFCNYPLDAICGAADQTGVCQPTPEVCADIYQPVCGCDGVTYGNSCEAAAKGVSVLARGECVDPAPGDPRHCGGLQGLDCQRGEFCNYPIDAICGAADQTGVCETMPGACTKIYRPVCGCDGVTYGNECMAHAAGVSTAAEGACPASGKKACGGLLGLQCASAEYCNYSTEAQCGFADATGVCQAKPAACTLEYDPVCGCNGKTYSNRCSAAAAGSSVASEGPCPN